MDASLGTGNPADRGVTESVPDVPPSLGDSARALIEAFANISSDLDTHSVLERLVASACSITNARYGALGIVDPGGELSEVITHGVEEKSSESSVQVPVRVRGTLFGQLCVTGKQDGAVFDEHDELLLTSLASVAGFVVENARAYGVSERRRRWLQMSTELSDRLVPPISLPEAMERIAESAVAASHAGSAAVIQVPADGEPFTVARAGELGDATPEEVQRLNEILRLVVASGEVHEIDLRDEWVVLLVPLRAHLTMPGVLSISHPRRGQPVDVEERDLLSSFADQAALALDRTQALEDREQMAVVSDRDRIARELHDVVIQRLFAMGLHMQSIRSAAETPELRERIDQSVKDLDQTIRDIRATIFELQTRPRSSLRSEIRDAVRELVPLLGFAPSVHLQGPVDNAIDPKLQQQLVAVLREALTNVAQHAQAGSVVVELQVGDRLVLKVSDNGRGIPEGSHENGLRNARRRAMLLGGSLDLWPNEPSGTVFVWQVPFDADSEGQPDPASGPK